MALALPASAAGTASYGTGEIPLNHLNHGNTTGGLSTTAGAWETIFGKPQGTDKFSPINPNRISSMNLPDAFRNRSKDLGTVILMTTFLAPNPFTTTIAPTRKTNDVRMSFRNIEFQPQLAQNLAHRAVSRLYTTSETSHNIALNRKFVNHAIEAELATTAYGVEYLKRIFYQMGTSFSETAALEVMLAIQQSGDIQYKFEQLRAETGTFMSFRDIMQREIINWDCAKDKTGKFWARLSATLSEYSKRFQNVNINTMVTSYAVMIHQNVENERNTYMQGGERGVARFENGPFAEIKVHNLTVVCPTSQRPGVGITDDLFTNRGMVGEVADIPEPTSHYRSEKRAIRLLDMHTRRMEVVKFEECIEHSGLFHAGGKGKLIAPVPGNGGNDDAIFRPNGTAFTAAELENVMTLTRYNKTAIEGMTANNHGEIPDRYQPNEFIGQMPAHALTVGNLHRIAEEVERHFGEARTLQYFTALARAQDIVKKAERTTYDDILAVLNVATGFALNESSNDGTKDTIGVSTATAAGIVDVYGNTTDDYPVVYPVDDNNIANRNAAIGRLRDCLVFPGYVSASGFRAVRDAVSRGFCNRGEVYEKCVGTAGEIAEIYPTLEQFANSLHDIFPDSFLLNKHATPNVHHYASPVDAFFANFICHDFYPVVFNNQRYPLYLHVSKVLQNQTVNPNNTGKVMGALPNPLSYGPAFSGLWRNHRGEMPATLRFMDYRLSTVDSTDVKEKEFRKQRYAFLASEALRARFKEVWTSNTSNLLRRAVLSTLIFTPLTRESLLRIEAAHVPSVLNFWVTVPHGQWIGKQLCLLEAGENTIVTYMMEGAAAMGFEVPCVSRREFARRGPC
jgi:hypothetical protein